MARFAFRAALVATLIATAPPACKQGASLESASAPQPVSAAAAESLNSAQAPTAAAVFGATESDGGARPEYLAPSPSSREAYTVTRISDASIAAAGASLRHAYARNQPWNADGSLIMLGFRYPAAVLDGRTLQFLRTIHQPMHAVWSHRDPHAAIGTLAGTNRLVKADMRLDGAIELIHAFDEYIEIDFGAGEGNLSNDDRYIALFGFSSQGTDLLVFDIAAKQIVGRTSYGAARVCDCPDPGSLNNATMSQSGEYVVVQYNERGAGRRKGVEVYSRALTFLRQLTTGSEHGDVGLTRAGADVWVAWRDSTGSDPLQDAAAYAWTLPDGAATAVIPLGTPLGHISCRNTRRPGYCFASHARAPGTPGSDLLYAFPLDGRMQMEVFAAQHSSHASYERQAMGTPDPQGVAVLWASDWNDVLAPTYAYVARPAAR